MLKDMADNTSPHSRKATISFHCWPNVNVSFVLILIWVIRRYFTIQLVRDKNKKEAVILTLSIILQADFGRLITEKSFAISRVSVKNAVCFSNRITVQIASREILVSEWP